MVQAVFQQRSLYALRRGAFPPIKFFLRKWIPRLKSFFRVFSIKSADFEGPLVVFNDSSRAPEIKKMYFRMGSMSKSSLILKFFTDRKCYHKKVSESP